jgi:hypothetical protein
MDAGAHQGWCAHMVVERGHELVQAELHLVLEGRLLSWLLITCNLCNMHSILGYEFFSENVI